MHSIVPRISEHVPGRLGAWLMGASYAIALAALANANAVFIATWQEATHSTGVDEPGAFVISSIGVDPAFDPGTSIQHDLELIRTTPGVLAATPAMVVPLSGLEISTGLSATPQKSTDQRAFLYPVDEQGVAAFGLKLVAGRGFTHDEVTVSGQLASHDRWDVIIVSNALAHALFGTSSAVGRDIYLGGKHSARIIGVVERLDGPLAQLPPVVRQRSIMVPQIAWLNNQSRYIVRSRETDAREVADRTQQRLAQANLQRQLEPVEFFTELRRDAYFWQFIIARFAGALICAVVLVNALGVFVRSRVEAAARFSMSRGKGGAREWFSYLSLPTVLPLLLGGATGVWLSFALNNWLVTHFYFQSLDMSTVSWGGALLVISSLGGLLAAAVRKPARRISR
jgi:putative ABC transport system permease protein